MLIEFTHKHNQLLWNLELYGDYNSISPLGRQAKQNLLCTLVQNSNTFEKIWIATNVISNKESVRSRQSNVLVLANTYLTRWDRKSRMDLTFS